MFVALCYIRRSDYCPYHVGKVLRLKSIPLSKISTEE
jgi:hypothetical protein